MPIDPRIITVFLDASLSGQKRAAHAASLAQRWEALLVGVHVVFAGVSFPMPHAIGDRAITDLSALGERLASDARAADDRVREHFQTQCAKLKVAGEFRPIGPEDSEQESIRIAFHSDLVLVGHPEPDGLPDHLSVEELLLASGAPILIVPNGWKGQTIGNKVLIGWNATREARRAVADAMAFLVDATTVTVLVIDRDGVHPHGEDQVSEIEVHLKRHGVPVHLEQLAALGHSIPTILLRYAEHKASDLLVVGAYSHPHFREVLLGGTTETLLASTSVPTFISR